MVNFTIIKQDIPSEYRQYIDSRDEAPDDVQVYEGEREDVLYYDTRDVDNSSNVQERISSVYPGLDQSDIQRENIIQGAAGITVNEIYEEGSKILSTLDDDELKDVLKSLPESNYRLPYYETPDIPGYLEGNAEYDDGSKLNSRDAVAVASHIQDDSKIIETLDEIFEEVEGKNAVKLAETFYTFPQSKEVKDHLVDNHPDLVDSFDEARINQDFINGDMDHEEWRYQWFGDWKMSEDTDSFFLTQFAVMNLDLNDGPAIPWTQSNPIKRCYTEDGFEDQIMQLKEEAKEELEDDPIILYRGVSNDITIRSQVESWTKSEDKARQFGNVMEAEVDPEDILMTYEQLDQNNHVGQFDREINGNDVEGVKEHLVLGGNLQ